jgi:hypothetical protein
MNVPPVSKSLDFSFFDSKSIARRASKAFQVAPNAGQGNIQD